MKSIAASLILLSLSCGSVHCSLPCYTLYYLDRSHNVCELQLNESGRPVGKPVRLTRLGGYHSYSVSPDGTYVVGLRGTGLDSEGPDGDPGIATWRAYLERVRGRRYARFLRASELLAEGRPVPGWSRDSRYAVFIDGVFDVEGGAVYDTRNGSRVVRFDLMPGPVSRDQRFAVLTVQKSDSSGGFETRVVDLKTGRWTGFLDDYCDSAWIGDSHTLVWTDTFNNLWTGKVTTTSSGPNLAKRRLIYEGDCGNLRYYPGKGLYFEDGVADKADAYFSSDLKTFRKAQIIKSGSQSPSAYDEAKRKPGAWRSEADYSPDRRLFVCPVDRGRNRMPEIRLFRKAGGSLALVRGKLPQWRDGESIWRSWGASAF